MTTNINVRMYGPMGEVFREWLASNIKEYGPRLCLEYNEAGDHLFSAFLKAIASRKITLYMLITLCDDKPTVDIVSSESLEKYLHEYFSQENPVTIVDPSSGSGCTVAWDEFGDSFSGLLVASWGQHESIVLSLKEELQGGIVFRGN